MDSEFVRQPGQFRLLGVADSRSDSGEMDFPELVKMKSSSNALMGRSNLCVFQAHFGVQQAAYGNAPEALQAPAEALQVAPETKRVEAAAGSNFRSPPTDVPRCVRDAASMG